jgi:hypothetical protein
MHRKRPQVLGTNLKRSESRRRAACASMIPRGLIALAATSALLMEVPGPPVLGPGTHWVDESPFRELLLFALMLSGMAARVLSLAIERRGAATHNKLPPVTVDRWEFVYPMDCWMPVGGTNAILGNTPFSPVTSRL